MDANYKWSIHFSILTPVLAFICILLMGGGHGCFTPAMLLFPWATFNTIWQDHLSMSLMCIGAFQFILYGVLIDKKRGSKNQKFVIASILFSHLILSSIILVLRSSDWR
ncbi:MAG: hypothetical protein IPP79_23460 [Chitinophagaceae bacterium]|nr:hypothetical protein [Chitinophagaceae bacterium]